MSKRRNFKHRSSNRDSSGFIALPWAVVDSEAFRRLGYSACRLLIEVARQYNGRNNGQLLASRAYFEKRGINSCRLIQQGKDELIVAGFLHETVKGRRPNRASWFALTWYPLDAHGDYDPGAERTFERGLYAKKIPPKAVEKIDVLNPDSGTVLFPKQEQWSQKMALSVPDSGAIRDKNDPLSVPDSGHHIDIYQVSGQFFSDAGTHTEPTSTDFELSDEPVKGQEKASAAPSMDAGKGQKRRAAPSKSKTIPAKQPENPAGGAKSARGRVKALSAGEGGLSVQKTPVRVIPNVTASLLGVAGTWRGAPRWYPVKVVH